MVRDGRGSRLTANGKKVSTRCDKVVQSPDLHLLCHCGQAPREKLFKEKGRDLSPHTVTGHFAPKSFRPGFLAPFLSHLALFKCHIPRSTSHKEKQANFKRNIPRSKKGG